MSSYQYSEDFLPALRTRHQDLISSYWDETVEFSDSENEAEPEPEPENARTPGNSIGDIMATPRVAVQSPEAAEGTITTLKAYINQLHDFIDKSFNVHKAPSEIQVCMYMRASGARRLAETILEQGSSPCQLLHELSVHVKLEITSDDFSVAVMPALRQCHALRRLRHQDALAVTWWVVLALQKLSLGTTARPLSYGERPSDGLADQLLRHVAAKRRRRGELWHWMRDLMRMTEERDILSDCGIDSWFPLTIGLLESWESEL